MKKSIPYKSLGAAMVVIAVIGGFFVFAQGDDSKEYPVVGELFIPPLVDSRSVGHDVRLVMQDTAHEFFAGVKSRTKGFSQSYLGPSIRLYRGETTRVHFHNRLDESTTVHGHGLHIAGDADGGPQSEIAAGATQSIALAIAQQAGTSWYHPHLKGKTAAHVHAGLAGLYLIEDDNSQALPLPKSYGVDDIPLIIQDRSFTDGKMQPYALDNDRIMDGLREQTLVVNGGINAHHTVPAGWVRLRLLNASNARFYRFFFSGDAPFYKIATEGGFLNAPLAMREISMAPGERNEIMIDLSAQDAITLFAEFLPADPSGIDFDAVDNLADIGEWLGGFMQPAAPVQRVVVLQADAAMRASGTLPDKLNDIAFHTAAERAGAVQRHLTLDMDEADDRGPIGDDNPFSINNRPMDMRRINHKATQGALELWTITAEMMPHPFHIHGTSFQIITHNGRAPSAEHRGWKDTVVVTEQPTQLLMRFDHLAAPSHPYMFHCHILEHEDFGMMGQFTVSPAR